jgi:hypothetical protein
LQETSQGNDAAEFLKAVGLQLILESSLFKLFSRESKVAENPTWFALDGMETF